MIRNWSKLPFYDWVNNKCNLEKFIQVILDVDFDLIYKPNSSETNQIY